MSTDVVVRFGREELILMSDRAVYWPAEEALLVSDIHLGKAAAFRAEAIAVPQGTTTTDLKRLDLLLEQTKARKLIVLGDLWHAKKGRHAETIRVVREWREGKSGIECTLVRGNHDRKSGPVPPEMGFVEEEEPWTLGDLMLCHEPCPGAEGFKLCGHIHPCVRLEGRGKLSMTVPCFWMHGQTLVLPSFGTFTGCCRIEPEEGDRVFLVAGQRVVEQPLAW